jgi:hypothetical protein
MSSFISLRAALKKKLVPVLQQNFWVTDTCLAVVGGTELNLDNKLTALKPLLAQDGVHLTPEGYRYVAKNISGILCEVYLGKCGKFAPSCSNPLPVSGNRRFHWRGFTSPVGSRSNTYPSGSSAYKSAKGRTFKAPGPYTGSKRGGGSKGKN